MAITQYNFNNTDYVRSSGKRVITCTSDKIGTVGVYNYRFYLEVIDGSNTYAYTFRYNAEEYGVINITKILQTLVEATNIQDEKTIPTGSSTLANIYKQNLHSIPHTFYNSSDTLQYPYYLSRGGNTTKKITLKLYDFYGDTATANPTKRATGSQTAYIYLLSGFDLSTDLINVDYTEYKLTSSNMKLLTDNYNFVDNLYYRIKTELTDYGTIAFLNTTETINTSADPHTIKITYYHSGGTTVQNLLQSDAYGGKYDASGVDEKFIIYAGVYPANLDKLPVAFTRPQDLTGLAYYSVEIVTSGGVARSVKYYFVIGSECQKYEKQRFAFLNSLGGWEYINFYEKRTDDIKSKNTSIKKSVLDYEGNYHTNSGGYNVAPLNEGVSVPNVGHRGEKIVATNFSETFTVNTGYLDNGDVEKIKAMFLSSQIDYINSDGSARAVVLQTSSIKDVKNIDKHYEQISYSLTFRYSVPTYNNIIY